MSKITKSELINEITQLKVLDISNKECHEALAEVSDDEHFEKWRMTHYKYAERIIRHKLDYLGKNAVFHLKANAINSESLVGDSITNLISFITLIVSITLALTDCPIKYFLIIVLVSIVGLIICLQNKFKYRDSFYDYIINDLIKNEAGNSHSDNRNYQSK